MNSVEATNLAQTEAAKRREEVRKLKDSGMTIRAIAGIFGVKPQRIWQLLNYEKYRASYRTGNPNGRPRGTGNKVKQPCDQEGA